LCVAFWGAGVTAEQVNAQAPFWTGHEPHAAKWAK
jgi:hypothetical protein